MSKLRENLLEVEGDLESPVVADLSTYIVFTQLRAGRPYVLAGYLDAVDDAMAMLLGKEHYGQDQECVSMWLIPRIYLASTEPQFPTSTEGDVERGWQVFVQKVAGDPHESSIVVKASHSEGALAAAKREVKDSGSMHCLWVVPQEVIVATAEGELIWRHVDQTYRLARGYAKKVRKTWEKIRSEEELAVYEKDNLQEEF